MKEIILKTMIVTNVIDLANYYNKFDIVKMEIVDGIGKNEQVVKISYYYKNERQ